MSDRLSFCQDANQSLRTLGTVIGKREQYDYEFDETIAYLQHYNLLGKDIDFTNWMELGKFLLIQKEKFRVGFMLLNEKQKVVLDQSLQTILGMGLYS
jgi:hypothetical protein